MSSKRTPQTRARRPRSVEQPKGRKRAESESVERALAHLSELKPKSRKAKNAIALFKSWLRDESGYDEEAWPELKQALEEHRARVGARGLFDA